MMKPVARWTCSLARPARLANSQTQTRTIVCSALRMAQERTVQMVRRASHAMRGRSQTTISVPASSARVAELASMGRAVRAATGRCRMRIGRHASHVLKAQLGQMVHVWPVILASSRRRTCWHVKSAQLAGRGLVARVRLTAAQESSQTLGAQHVSRVLLEITAQQVTVASAAL